KGVSLPFTTQCFPLINSALAFGPFPSLEICSPKMKFTHKTS
ncbi:uncharacterized, partial [Tachysurus ichikawai]